MTVTSTKVINSMASAACLMHHNPQVSPFLVNVPRSWRLASEVFICTFNQSQFSTTCTAVIAKAGDFLASAYLAGEFKALDAGTGEIADPTQANAAHVNMPIVASFTEARMETPTDSIEKTWPHGVVVLQEIGGDFSSRMPALCGHETTALARIKNATKTMVYMVLLPFAHSRSLAQAFMISAALLSPAQVAVDVKAFSDIAYSEQYTLNGSTHVPVVPEQDGSSSLSIKLWLVCVYYQITKAQRTYLISLAMEVLLTVMFRYSNNAVSLSQPLNNASLPFSTTEIVRGIFVVAQNSAAINGKFAAGHRWSDYGQDYDSTGTAAHPLASSVLQIDGENREAVHSPEVSQHISFAKQKCSKQSRRFLAFHAETTDIKDIASPGSYNYAACDSSQFQLVLVGPSDPPSTTPQALVTFLALAFVLWKYAGSQFYPVYC